MYHHHLRNRDNPLKGTYYYGNYTVYNLYNVGNRREDHCARVVEVHNWEEGVGDERNNYIVADRLVLSLWGMQGMVDVHDNGDVYSVSIAFFHQIFASMPLVYCG